MIWGDLVSQSASLDNYFSKDFERLLEEPLAMKKYLTWEKELQGLDDEAWVALKGNCSPYLTSKDQNGRGWQQLFDHLGEAYAYNYLRRIGCQDVGFIPRSEKPGVETPDLKGIDEFGKVVLVRSKNDQHFGR
jgi:hypothetical protein